MPISEWGRSISGQYPDPRGWPVYNDDMKQDLFRFVRLWMMEGIPFLFKDCPMVFEAGREVIGRALDVSPKVVSLVGSARLGFSLASYKFGRPYDQRKSDVDLIAVSDVLFAKLAPEFQLFRERFESGKAQPRNDAERRYWPKNVEVTTVNVEKGFLDTRKIPSSSAYYPVVARANDACARFAARVNELSGRAVIREASLRVYRNWDAAISQAGGSLVMALKQRPS